MTATKVSKICVKHPELGGLRRADSGTCLSCYAEASKRWKLANPERVKARRAKNYLKDKEHTPEKLKEQRKRDYTNNYQRFVDGVIQRRLLTKQQTPGWADKSAIGEIYRKARELGMTVDHIVPLRGKNVCGLHTESNLRIISAKENCSKRNTFHSGTIESLLGGMGARL